MFLSEHSLYVIVFNVHDPFKIESVLRWMLLMRSKASDSNYVQIIKKGFNLNTQTVWVGNPAALIVAVLTNPI